MDELISFLEKWQTMIGAIIGGIFALFVALLVAYKARRQEDLAAGMLLTGNLISIIGNGLTLKELAKEQNIKEEQLPYWLSEHLVRQRMKLSPVFEASRIRLMPNDVYLAAHLELFQLIFNDIDAKIGELSLDIHALDTTGKPIRNQDVLQADARIIYKGFQRVMTHAKCAERILNHKVLSNYPTFHTIRMLICKSKEEKACVRTLKTGE